MLAATSSSTREIRGPLLLGLALRALVAFVLLRGMPLVSDAESYADEALAFLRQLPPPHAFYWPPGNPLVLSAAYHLLGPGVLATRLTMLVLSILSVVVVHRVSMRLWPQSAQSTAYLSAAYLPAVLLTGQSYAQHLAALCLLCVAWAGWPALCDGRLGAALGLGAAFGMGCLTRPSLLSVTPVLGLAWLWALRRSPGSLRPRLVGAALLAALTAAALIGPALAHNQGLGVGLVLSTNNERNFFLGNNPYTPDYKTSHLGQRDLAQLPAEVRDYLEGIYRQPHPREVMKAEALRYIAAHPVRTLYRTWNRTLSFWGFDYLAARIIQIHLGAGTAGLMMLLLLEAGSYLMVMVLALLGLWSLWALSKRQAADGPDRAYALWLVGLVLLYQLPYSLAFSGGTYHYPALWLMMPFAGVSLSRLMDPQDRRALLAQARSPQVLVTLALFLLLQAQYAYYAVLLKG